MNMHDFYVKYKVEYVTKDQDYKLTKKTEATIKDEVIVFMPNF